MLRTMIFNGLSVIVASIINKTIRINYIFYQKKMIENISSNNFSFQPSITKSFAAKAEKFMTQTGQYAVQGLNPGGFYQAIWYRDASYILKSWFHSGNLQGLLQHLSIIWSHQITPGKEKIIYGRGSPEMGYKAIVVKEDKQEEFSGALPTTTYQAGFSEVYGQNPDIDSTALMISTTSWILAKILKDSENNHDGGSSKSSLLSSLSSSVHNNASTITDNTNNKTRGYYISRITDNQNSSTKSMVNYSKVIDFLVPCMLKAVDYLLGRDIDNDGLIEQNHNEDWMDTGLRAGKIVYSQACWILALNNFFHLLLELNQRNRAERMMKIVDKTIRAVEEKLWSEEDGCYIDIQESHHIGGPYRTLTQDVSLYLVAISEITNSDSLRIHQHNQDRNASNNNNNNNDNSSRQKEHPLKQRSTNKYYQINQQQQNLDSLVKRCNSTLDAIRKRIWLNNWPLNVEVLLKRSGPWHLKPYFYHNRTFWPWITGIEMLARSRFNRFDECNILLSKLTSANKAHVHTLYEWVNPKTGEGGGAYPFRTGICNVRMVIDHILSSIEQKSRIK